MRADLAGWRAWCEERGAAPVPALPELLAACVDEQGAVRASATVRRYVASVATLHRAAGAPDPVRSDAVRLAFRRFARAKGTSHHQAAPLGELAAERVVATSGSGLTDLPDVALLLVSRDLFARRGEVVALTVANVEPSDDGSGTAVISRSKTDAAGEGSVGYLAPRTMRALRA